MGIMNQPLTCDLSIVIVSWNVWPLLQNCLASIERASLPGEGAARQLQPLRQGDVPNLQNATLEVIVVDNASADDTPAQIAVQFPWVRVIASDKNLGFTGGNNRGYAASCGRFVYFLNPDTELVEGTRLEGTGRKGEEVTAPGQVGDVPRERVDSEPFSAESAHLQILPSRNPAISASLLRLYAAISADASIGVIGPQLRYADGAAQPSARRFPTPVSGFFESTWLGRAWPSNPWAQTLLMTEWPVGQCGDVDWLVGAAMLCRRTTLDAVATADGPFDEGFFMYSEEMDLCRRIKQAGWRVVYEPAALVIHHEGKSSEQISTRRHILFNTSKVRYWRKWFGPRWAEALRRYLLLEYRLQIGVEWCKAALGHKSAMRRTRIAAYREVLGSELRD
jgi:GT2 family glycosyltransferase